MVVQHNLTAINANRMLGITQGTLSSSTEKLSSGYKINRAADDAAGLSISEKMRKQIRGLTKASSNAEDGISAVQTAEGALQEVTDMLQRMNELAVQASNGTNSTTDRQSIQDEIDQLTTEIDRVAETTKFNETYLLKGNADGTSSSQLVNAHDAGLAGKLVDNGKTAKFTVDSKLNEGDKVTIAGAEYTIGTDATGKSGTDGYKKLDADATAVKAGDSLTDKSSSITYTIVDKIDFANVKSTATGATVGALKIQSGKSAFTITHDDGSTVTYNVNDTAGAGNISAADADDLIKQELAAGSKITMTKDTNGNSCNIEVVDKLTTTGANREISSYDVKLITAAGVNQSTVDNLAKAASFAN
ncbi:MAG: flagellar hook protein, partial [Roseburia sp.]|nr:flagellar hook protein [Roseburia sp.]